MKALIVYGGWEGHDPEGVSAFLERLLKSEGFETHRTDDLNALGNEQSLQGASLIVPVITMAEPPNLAPLFKAVENGAGIAGCHGGMCDSFRNNTEWQFLTGGQFVAHPGDILPYRVQVKDHEHPITQGLQDFDVETEQYYMHVDPAIHVLLTTRAPQAPGPHAQVEMPVAWTKRWGAGRVFYSALGHSLADLEAPAPGELMRRGMLWAAGRL